MYMWDRSRLRWWMDGMYSKLNCLKNYVLTCKKESIAAKLTGKIQNAWIWSIQYFCFWPTRNILCAVNKRSISQTGGFEDRLFSVKQAWSLTKFTSWFTVDLYVVLLELQLHCKWVSSAAQIRGKTCWNTAILVLTTAIAQLSAEIS